MSRPGGLSVRMYDVGFGDCFLLTYAGGIRPWRMLIDCGSHLSSGPATGSIRDVARGLIEDCRDEDGLARVTVVVATHRHFDHIAGFDLADWAEVEVEEVWLPWTEDPTDPTAGRIRAGQRRLEAALTSMVRRTRANAATLELLGNVSLSNNAAMTTLHRGFAGQPQKRFLPSAGEPPTWTADVLSGVTVHVLGPSRDEATIRALEPPADQSYLRLAGSPDGSDGPIRPFPGLGQELPRGGKDPKIAAMERVVRQDFFDLAASLEAAVNGTCLVLALEIGRAVLVFGGDAQWGTWRAALEVPAWQALLRRTTFFKVGRHGSHNATPKRLVDSYLPDGFWAMLSVRRVERWPRVPKTELLGRLAEKGVRVIRIDERPAEPLGGVRYAPDGRYVELDLAT